MRIMLVWVYTYCLSFILLCTLIYLKAYQESSRLLHIRFLLVLRSNPFNTLFHNIVIQFGSTPLSCLCSTVSRGAPACVRPYHKHDSKVVLLVTRSYRICCCLFRALKLRSLLQV